jgi:hypothetical protein
MKSNKAARHVSGQRSSTPCVHGRMVDVVRSDDGERTENLRCMECGAVFPDLEAASKREVNVFPSSIAMNAQTC